jgi:hypothetical protein
MICIASFMLVACAKLAPARIVVQPAVQELGEVPQEIINLIYTVRNDGQSDLQILKISTSCDCTKATIAKDIIGPGQSADLTVMLDPIEDNLYGDITRVIYLRSNDPKNPEVSVEFHAIIQQPEEK